MGFSLRQGVFKLRRREDIKKIKKWNFYCLKENISAEHRKKS